MAATKKASKSRVSTAKPAKPTDRKRSAKSGARTAAPGTKTPARRATGKASTPARKAPGETASKAKASTSWATVTYPFPVPLSRESLGRALEQLDALRALRASYLTFFFLPVEERIGQWRFAGASSDLAAAIEQIGAYGASMMRRPDESPVEQLASMMEGEVLEIGTPETVWGYRKNATFQDVLDEQDEDEEGEPLPVEKLPPYQLILFAQGGAPYDDFGFAIVEVKTLGAYQGRKPDTRRPSTWPEEDK